MRRIDVLGEVEPSAERRMGYAQPDHVVDISRVQNACCRPFLLMSAMQEGIENLDHEHAYYRSLGIEPSSFSPHILIMSNLCVGRRLPLRYGEDGGVSGHRKPGEIEYDCKLDYECLMIVLL